MDYETKPVSRVLLRKYAAVMRMLFGIPNSGPLPVLEMLDRMKDVPVFKGTEYEILDDKEFTPNNPARCYPDECGCFHIELAEHVYNGAYVRNVGAYLGFICHEMCHVFLYRAGYTPILARNIDAKSIPAYKSVEWQAMAMTGEVMLPYEETKGLGLFELRRKYHVSKATAEYRLRY